MGKALAHLKLINKQDEYGTPLDLLSKAMSNYKIFPSMDVCSNRANAKFSKFFTIDDNALRQEWNEDFFMNPPYSKIKQFMHYAYAQHIKHNVSALVLTYAKTDTHWWHELIEGKAEVHFVQGRIKFNNELGQKTKYPAPYPSCWIIWRSNK
jgi:site-specific DNA-methyltransferase (adenine-specific)